MAAWFIKFWQMSMDPSLKSLVLVRTYKNHAAGCLVWPYTVSVCWIFSVPSRTQVGVRARSNVWVSLVLILGMT